MKLSDKNGAALRKLPSVNHVLESPALRELANTLPAVLLAEAARTLLEAARQTLLSVPESEGTPPDAETLARDAAAFALRRAAPALQSAINATGIALHTGLGRARLAPAAVSAVNEIAANHCNLEIDRDTGKRGSRRAIVRDLLCELTGAEDAAVVNNCAGAVFLSIAALAAGREVIISRGELVEIGGEFRMPDIIRASGAVLVEVGATNRTRLRDYRAAITERTGLILRCRPSNFAIIGFTEEAGARELAALGRERNIPVMDDQGSGAILSLDGLGGAGGKGTLREPFAQAPILLRQAEINCLAGRKQV